jgi:hypothetical protein
MADGPIGAAFVSEFDQADSLPRVPTARMGGLPFV